MPSRSKTLKPTKIRKSAPSKTERDPSESGHADSPARWAPLFQSACQPEFYRFWGSGDASRTKPRGPVSSFAHSRWRPPLAESGQILCEPVSVPRRQHDEWVWRPGLAPCCLQRKQMADQIEGRFALQIAIVNPEPDPAILHRYGRVCRPLRRTPDPKHAADHCGPVSIGWSGRNKASMRGRRLHRLRQRRENSQKRPAPDRQGVSRRRLVCDR